jgi:hypothetical protein
MPGFFHLLCCIGRVAVKNGARALARLVPFGETAFEIARDAQEEYRRDHLEAELRSELEELVKASPAEVHQIAEAVAAREAAGQPAEVHINLVSYLDQVQESVRQSRGVSSESQPLRGGTGVSPVRLGTGETPVLQLQAAVKEAQPKVTPVTLKSPQRTYTLLTLLGVGDVSDVYLADGGSDVGRVSETLYVLKVSRTPEGNILLDNERRALTELCSAAGDTTYRKYLPTLAEHFTVKDKLSKRVNAFLHEPGWYTLEKVHEQHPVLDGRHLAWIYKRLLTVLGFCHGQNRVHGAVLPCHVLLHAADHGLQLVGWGQSVQTGRPIRTLSKCYTSWYPPEVRDRKAAGPSTDLFLAAKCLNYLAGGDPVRDRVPETVPAPLRGLLEACLLEGARMRPNDAWGLTDELDKLLRGLYGPPKFYPLTMT